MRKLTLAAWGAALATAGLLGACTLQTGTPASPTEAGPRPTATLAAPTAAPSPTLTPEPTRPAFEAATYMDEAAGFALDVPASWTGGETQPGGDRGYFVQWTSWPHAPGEIPAETPPGGTRLQVSVLAWDPKNDLEAYAANRQRAWSASGMTVLSEEAWTLAGGWPARRFLILSPDQSEQALFMFTAVGERYLELSGTGDLDLLEAIARTLRAAP